MRGMEQRESGGSAAALELAVLGLLIAVGLGFCALDAVRPFASNLPHTLFAKEWTGIRVVFIVLTAVLLGARRRDRSVRALAYFLLAVGLTCDWWTYPAPLALVGRALREGSSAVGFPSLIAFALALGRGTLPETLVGRLRAILPWFTAGYALLVIAKDAATVRFNGDLRAIGVAVYALDGVIAAVVLALLVRYAVASAERERQKATWIAISFGIAIVGGMTYLGAAFRPGGSVWGNAGALAMIALPAGIAYAILRHRLLDVSFAVDQAVAYAIATFVLLVVFTGMDWFAKERLQGPADQRSFVNLIAAGTVLFALRLVHQRVNEAVRATVFRQRTARLAALRDLSGDVRFFHDPGQLERELVNRLDAILDGCGCAQYERAGTRLVRTAGTQGTTETIDMNDIAIRRIQKTGSCLRVGEVSSNLRAAYVFPIIARGVLNGVVLLGTGDSLRYYAPDEIEAIQQVVRSAGDTHQVLQAYAAAGTPAAQQLRESSSA